jgi:hypothetical protein
MTLKKAVLCLGYIALFFLVGCEQAAGPAKDNLDDVSDDKQEWTVTVDPALSNGSILAEPSKAPEGTQITLTVSPGEDHYLEDGYPLVTDAKGETLGPVTEEEEEPLVFVFAMPARDVQVSARFARVSDGVFSIQVDPSVINGTITASVSESKERKTITVTLAPDPQMQYHSGSLKVNGGEVKVSGSKTRHSFTMPAKDVVLSAEFKPYNSIVTGEEFTQIGRTEDFPLDEIYEINADITIADWSPPDSVSKPFAGVIYGKGHTITLQNFSPSALSGAEYLGIFAYLRGAAIQDLRIAGAAGPLSVTAAQYCGLLAGYADNATLKNIAVAGTLDITRTSGNLYLGGLTGYMQGGSLESDSAYRTSSVSVTGTSPGSVYGGGMIGYAMNVTVISGANTTGNVTVTGEGHNTSAGGLCAFSRASKIVSCSAEGDISVVADSHGQTAMGYLYMTYAGGLVGESVNLGATITRSYATGNVYAKSPYPYAGGLCGYNYGESVIAECYATGSATADSQGALPYAGGLSGYNSAQAKIQDSYAMGIVKTVSTASSGWAGGIVSSNARDAVVSRCYSLSAVDAIAGSGGLPPVGQPGVTAGGSAGGIAGHTYFTNFTPPLTKIENCTALNSALAGKNVHRVTGSIADNAILANNIGWTGMDWTPGPEAAEKTADGLDGADCDAKPAQSVYEGLSWDFVAVWTMGNNGYPKLRWQQ